MHLPRRLLVSSLLCVSLLPSYGARAQVRQPKVDLGFTSASPGQPAGGILGPSSQETFGGGPMPFALSDSFSAPPVVFLTDGCSGNAAGVAGIGMPAAATLAEAASASAQCPSELSLGNSFVSEATSSALRLYKVKGPGALATGADVSLFARLHGVLSGSSDFGPVLNNARHSAQVSISASGVPRLTGPNSLGALTSMTQISGNPPLLQGDFLADIVDHSTASTAIFELDHTLQTDFTVLGWLAAVSLTVDCQATTTEAGNLATPAQLASCAFDLGDTEAYLQSNAPSLTLERVAPLRPTTPRSAVYLSPASAPIQTFPGTPGLPTSASGSGPLGLGATGDGDAHANLPLVISELVAETGASSHVDQSPMTVDANATIASEGQSAISLRYHLTRLNGFTGIPTVQVAYTVDTTLSATSGLDASILERASFELSADVQGAPSFYFATLSLGSSNEDPPGISGNLGNACIDQSSPGTQSCRITSIPADPAIPVIPDKHDDLVLTVQSDCATSLAHPAGALPAAHPACDASHTATARLVSTNPDVVLTAVPEPEGQALAAACLVALAALASRRPAKPRQAAPFPARRG